MVFILRVLVEMTKSTGRKKPVVPNRDDKTRLKVGKIKQEEMT